MSLFADKQEAKAGAARWIDSRRGSAVDSVLFFFSQVLSDKVAWEPSDFEAASSV